MVLDAVFTALWDAAGSLAAVVAGVSEGAARPVRRWAVLARDRFSGARCNLKY